MAEREDVFESFEPAILARSLGSPWTQPSGEPPRYEPDLALLEELLSIPVRDGKASESGRFAKATDAWVAYELRRAGFPPDEVWPRLTRPRVLPREVALFVAKMPGRLRAELEARLPKVTSVAPSDARVLGRAYVKQVDVLIAQWARGPELIVSTKTMVSSFRNNLPNRFEESYGDAKNLRGRYPLVALGFFFVLRSTVLNEPGTFDKAVDMLRKLKAESDVYDATCLVLADWSDDEFDGVRVLDEPVPADLRAGRFLQTLVDAVLARTPIEMHVAVRELRDKREIALAESEDGELVTEAPEAADTDHLDGAREQVGDAEG